MRKLAFAAAILLLVGMAAPLAGDVKGKTHDVTAQVVAVDVEGHTLTIKSDKGDDKTLPVAESAVDSLKTVKAGEKVVLTCSDNDKGEHQSIVAIRPAKA